MSNLKKQLNDVIPTVFAVVVITFIWAQIYGRKSSTGHAVVCSQNTDRQHGYLARGEKHV